MKDGKSFEFIIDRATCTMTVRREFGGTRQLVWDCHTKSDLLDQWFAPEPLTTRTKSMEFRAGGHWHYAMIMPDGQEFWARLDYQAIRPIDGYDALDGFCDATGALAEGMPQASWTVSFQDLGPRTKVQTIVRYASLEDLEKVMAMGMQEGLTSTMDRLDGLLAKLNAA